MGENGHRLLMGKVLFGGKIILETGLHIGGSEESMQIGGVALPVIRDSANNLPYIPGSSLKGKLRSTLEKFGERIKENKREKLSSNRNIGTYRNPLFIHCCEDARYSLSCDVCRIFGSSGDDRSVPRGEKAENFPSLLMVRDCLLDESLIEVSSVFTEVKIETGIDRTTMSANPRRIERVLPDNVFKFEMVYTVDSLGFTGRDKPCFREDALKRDLNNLLTCMEIIQNEGIGGYTSRGYGKIKFTFKEFVGRSLGYFMGDEKKWNGKVEKEGEFTIEEARGEIDNIVNFLKKEAQGVIAGKA